MVVLNPEWDMTKCNRWSDIWAALFTPPFFIYVPFIFFYVIKNKLFRLRE